MKTSIARLFGVALLLSLALIPALSEAQRRGGHWHGGGRGAWGPSFGISLGIGVPLLYPYDYYAYPRTVIVSPPLVYAQPAPVIAAPEATSPARPDPVIYPRNGQSPEQAEADTRACNSWATTQPHAMADASVFKRATEACMDGRGYTVR